MYEYECMRNDRSTLALTLFRSVRNIICSAPRAQAFMPLQKGGQSLGVQEYEYAIYPHKGYWHQTDLYKKAVEFNVPVKLIQTTRRKGSLPLEKSFYSVDQENIVLSAFKKSEDRDSYILRLFNPTDSTLNTTVTFGAALREAFLVTLAEERISSVSICQKNNSIGLSIAGNKIVTVEVIL